MMQKKILPYKETQLHYKIIGEGNTIVLLHGFGEDSTIWDHFIKSLSENYQLIVPDIPGSGSSALLNGAHVGMEDYAATIFAILKHENIKKCSMVGHSMGGYITLAFAEKYPLMLHAFGLFHSSAYADDEAKKDTRKKAIEFIRQKGPVTFLKTSIPGLFADPVLNKQNINTLVEKASQFKPEALIQYYKAMITRPDRTEILRSTSCPVLFLLGTYDKAVPFEQGLQQSIMPSIAHIHILSSSGHMGMMEEPEKSLLKFAHFLSAIYV